MSEEQTSSVQSATPFHWSRDYVEHLRTVHFGLIGLSLGLILIVASAKSYSPNVALREIEQILKLKKSWSPLWLRKNGAQTDWEPKNGKETSGGVGGFIDQVDIDPSQSEYFAVVNSDLPKRRSTRAFHLPRPNYFPEKSSVEWSANDFPDSLSDFSTWSDGMPYSAYFPVYLSRIGQIGTPTRVTGSFSEVTQIQEEYIKKLPLDSPLTFEFVARPEEDFFEYMVSSPQLDVYSLPIEEVLKSEVNHYVLAQHFFGWRDSSFKMAFADLADAARGFESLDLERIRQIMADDAAKGNQVFEAFGIKFPAEQITTWGVVLVLSVQLYLLVYLRQLVGKLRIGDPGWDVPWLGMDESRLGKSLFFATLTILPLISTSLLAVFSIRQLWLDHWHWQGLHVSTGPMSVSWWVFTGNLSIWAVVILGCFLLALLSWRSRPLAFTPTAISQDASDPT
jgi:hypothetical protein